jgi:hypothetical protein
VGVDDIDVELDELLEDDDDDEEYEQHDFVFVVDVVVF